MNENDEVMALTDWFEGQKERAQRRIDDDRVGEEETLKSKGELRTIKSIESYLEVGVLKLE